MPETKKRSMKTILRTEIIKRVKSLKVGERVRRCDLRRSILQDPNITRDLIVRITLCGTKPMSVNQILRRVDRVYSDALDSIESVYLDYDSEKHISWVVKDDGK